MPVTRTLEADGSPPRLRSTKSGDDVASLNATFISYASWALVAYRYALADYIRPMLEVRKNKHYLTHESLAAPPLPFL